jgi:hypothetical protein
MLECKALQVSFVPLVHLEEVKHAIAMDTPQPTAKRILWVVGKISDATDQIKPDQLNQFRRIATVTHLSFGPTHQHRMVSREELLPRLAIIPSLDFFEQKNTGGPIEIRSCGWLSHGPLSPSSDPFPPSGVDPCRTR